MDFDGNIPIYQQIKEIIKRQIISGELASGGKIRPVRELAIEMGVNPNTMQKALSELEAEGCLYSERTSGRFVTGNIKKISEMKDIMLRNEINKFLAALNKMGFTDQDILKLLEEYIKGGAV